MTTHTVRVLAPLAGEWTGTNRTRVMPEDPYTESPSTATVRPVARSRLVSVSYTWTGDGAEQDGFLLLSDGDTPGSVTAVWCDSWHQSPRWMTCIGAVDDTGAVVVAGSYGRATDHTGWRVTLASDDSTFRLTMHNVVPDADYQVVEATFRRSSTTRST